MADVPASEFLHKYGEFLIHCWGDPALKAKFLSEPEKTLKAFGLDPEGAKIAIRKPGESASLNVPATPESQVQLWNQGKKSGTIEFYFPTEPPPDMAQRELSDQELMAVAGGGWSVSCCCCSPCCCC